MNATNATSEAPRQGAGETAPPNRLYYGDCLTIMQDMPAGSVDLIYLDPPFNSNRAYNAIYRDETGRPLPDQIEAFCDLWELGHRTGTGDTGSAGGDAGRRHRRRRR